MDQVSPDVYQSEMKPLGKTSEQDLDRLFSGKVPPGSSLDDIATLARKVQSNFSAQIGPGLESAHLAAVMQAVNLTDKGDLAVRPASKVTGPATQASGLPKLRRRFMLESLFASLAAKIAAGGIAIAMAAVPVAASGNFPDQMQTGISQAVENIGIHIPAGDAEEARKKAEDAAQAAEEAGEDATDEVTDVEDDVDGNGEGSGNEPNENAAFGQSVAADARDGGVDGQEINEAAHARNEERKAARETPTPEPTESVVPEDAGTQSQTGLDRAANTPAASHLPATVPGARPEGAGKP